MTKSGCAKRCKSITSIEPRNPCPGIEKLLSYRKDRGQTIEEDCLKAFSDRAKIELCSDVYELVKRERCLIDWIKRYSETMGNENSD